MIAQQLKQLYRITARLTVIVGVLLSFFAILELVRAYQLLHDLHPALALAFLILILALVLAAILWLASAYTRTPKVLVAPPAHKLRKYARYLARYLQRLEQNALLDEDHRSLAQQGRRHLLAARADQPALQAAIRDTEQQYVEPVLRFLDNQAEKHVRTGVRDVMFAVTLNPYRSIDLLVVIVRNLGIVRNVMLVYNTRPRLRETLAILYDTARVVAGVNFVNLGGKMIENITKGLPGMIPGISRIIDDCAEGLAAGLLTSVTGHAALLRCRAFRPWNVEQARSNLASQLKNFSSDVGKIFFSDIIPKVNIPLGLGLDKWKQITDNLSHGFYDTIAAIHNFIKHPRSP